MTRGLGFRAVTRGDWKATTGAEGKAARIGATGGMRMTIGDLKAGIRAEVLAAGLGPKVAKSVQDYVYPKSGVSLSPAGTVVSKAPRILRGFEEGSIIRPKSGGRFLALPTQDTPFGRGGSHIKMRDAEKRFGPPAIVARGRNRLVFFNVRETKDRLGYRKRTKSGAGARFVLMYVLVPLVRLPKKINAAAALARAGAALDHNIVAAWPEIKGQAL